MRAIFLLTIILLSSCDNNEYKLLTLVNKSNDTIYYCFENKDVFTYNNPIVSRNKKIDFVNSSVIMPGDSTVIDRRTNSESWPHYINGVSDKTLRIFFFSHKNIAYATWDSVLKSQYYEKLTKLSVDSLEKINWRVIYR